MSFSPVSAVFDMLSNVEFNEDCISPFTPPLDSKTPTKPSSNRSVPHLTPTSDDFHSDVGPVTPGGDPLFEGWLTGVDDDTPLTFTADSCSDDEVDKFSMGQGVDGKILDDSVLDSLVLDCTPLPVHAAHPSMTSLWDTNTVEVSASPVRDSWSPTAVVEQLSQTTISFGSMDDMFLSASLHTAATPSLGSVAQHMLQSAPMQKSWSQPHNPLQEMLSQPMHHSHPLSFLRPEQISMLSSVATSYDESTVPASMATSSLDGCGSTSSPISRSAPTTPPSCLHGSLPPVPPLDKDDLEASIRRRTSDETLAQSHARVRKQLARATRLVDIHHRAQYVQSASEQPTTPMIGHYDHRRPQQTIDHTVVNPSYANHYSPPSHSASPMGLLPYQMPYTRYPSCFPSAIPHFQPTRQTKPLPRRLSPAPASPSSPAISFVNFTSADAQRLSSAVAPSGSGKRKQRELELQRQEKRVRTAQ